jgi:hypothetical protein
MSYGQVYRRDLTLLAMTAAQKENIATAAHPDSSCESPGNEPPACNRWHTETLTNSREQFAFAI